MISLLGREEDELLLIDNESISKCRRESELSEGSIDVGTCSAKGKGGSRYTLVCTRTHLFGRSLTPSIFLSSLADRVSAQTGPMLVARLSSTQDSVHAGITTRKPKYIVFLLNTLLIGEREVAMGRLEIVLKIS